MKKILGLVFGLMIGAFSFAQSPVTFNENVSTYDKNATTVFHFNFDATITEESINSNKKYYTDYFTVGSTANAHGGHDVTITLAQDDELSRKVVQRFFASLQVEKINVNGSEIAMTDFISTYILK